MGLKKEQERWILPGLCVVGSLLLYVGLTFFLKGESEIVGNRLEAGMGMEALSMKLRLMVFWKNPLI